MNKIALLCVAIVTGFVSCKKDAVRLVGLFASKVEPGIEELKSAIEK